MTDRRAGFLLVVLSLAVGLAFQGARGLYEPTEGRYAEAAREMRETGNYLEPTVGYRLHWTKPPLTYWCIAAGLALAGSNTWGARAYGVVVLPLTVLAVAALGASLWNRDTGYLAGLVYLSSPFPALSAFVVTPDALLALWEMLAVLAYAKARGSVDRITSRRWVRAMWVMFGLAFLTKGPPGILPLLALIVFHLVARRPFRLFDPLGIVAFVAISFGWYGLMVARHPDLLSYFVGHELVGRNMTSEFHRNPHWWAPFVIYLPMLTLGLGVWIYDAVRVARHERLYSPRRIAHNLAQPNSPGGFLLLWFVVPLLFFSLSRSRLPLYVLPLCAPLALAVARGLAAGADRLGVRRRVLRLALGSVVVLIGIKGVASYVPSSLDAARLHREAASAGGPGARFVLFEESTLYGFQFYAGGDVERVSVKGVEPWADHSLREFLTDVVSRQSTVIVTRNAAAPAMRRALVRANIPFSQVLLRERELLVVQASR